VKVNYDCLGFGICAADYLCIVPKYPELDEKTEAIEFSLQGGGPVATALVTLARLGCTTTFIGRIGNDANGKFLLNEFASENVDTTGIIIDESTPTNQAFIWIDQKTGKKSIVLNSKHYRKVLPTEINLDHIGSLRYLLIDGRDTAATFELIEYARTKGARIIIDAGSPRDRTDELLRLVDYPVVSETFCQKHLKLTDYNEAIKKLLDFGAKAAVVTCGSNGCYGGDLNGIYYQSAFQVNVVDTTGAGDVFHGAFIFGLLKNWELTEVLRFASATAAIKCTKIGGRSAVPDFYSANKFLQKFQTEEIHQ
jgi:sulfofructose kinase